MIKLFESLRKEWRTIKAAPWSFGIVCIVVVATAFSGFRWFYGGKIAETEQRAQNWKDNADYWRDKASRPSVSPTALPCISAAHIKYPPISPKGFVLGGNIKGSSNIEGNVGQQGSGNSAQIGNITNNYGSEHEDGSAIPALSDGQRSVLKMKLNALKGNAVLLVLVGSDVKARVFYDQLLDIFSDSQWNVGQQEIGSVGGVGENFPPGPYITGPDMSAQVVGEVFSIFHARGLNLPLVPRAFAGDGLGGEPPLVIVVH